MVKHSKGKEEKIEREKREGEKEGEGKVDEKRDDGVNSTLYRRPPSPLSPCNPLEEFKFTLALSPRHLFFFFLTLLSIALDLPLNAIPLLPIECQPFQDESTRRIEFVAAPRKITLQRSE